MKKKFSSEFAYILGLLFIAWGVVLMEKADFGISMIVAPAYLLYRWLSPQWSFFTFGMAEYCFQAMLLILMSLVIRRFRVSYLFSFVTAVIYGLILDGLMLVGTYLPLDPVWLRVPYYILGMFFGQAGVAVIFHTYLSPEVYELFVKEVSSHFHININRFKTAYDCSSCLLGIAMSFMMFGLWHFEGVKLGTILHALINGAMIGIFSAFLDNHWTFYDRFPWRKFFEASDKPSESFTSR